MGTPKYLLFEQMKRILFILILSTFITLPSLANVLRGRVMLNDSTPCSYATVYLPTLNRGTASNTDGEYILDGLPLGTLQVEYSCIGQQTAKRELKIVAGDTLTNNVMLSEKVTLLPPSIVTVDGESPAHYVLRHVWEQSEVNRKNIDTWQAEVKYALGMNDVDLFTNLFPKKYMFVIKTAMTLVGLRKLFNLVLDHPSLKAKVSLVRTYAKNKATDSEQKVTYSSEKLTESEQKTLYKNKLLISKDLFDEVYAKDNDWGSKGELRDKYELVGTYEQDGKVIDVLEYISITKGPEKSKETEGGVKEKKKTTTINRVHVVEEDWGILKTESNNSYFHTSIECRDLGSGVYMPISSSNRLKFPTMSADSIPGMIEAAEKALDEDKDLSKTQRKVAENLIKELKDHQGRDIDIELYFTYDIKYRYFKLKK